MIKLNLPAKPVELTPKKEQELIEQYKKDASSVWRQPYIIQALLHMTSNKCAYSEQMINTQSAYMEVEHFKNKDRYPDEVVAWGNLLPSCKKCNTVKGNWDVVSYPIVNPAIDDPKDFLYICGGRYYAKDKIGENTIAAVALNDRTHFADHRMLIAIKLVESLETAYYNLQEANTPLKQRRAIGGIKNLLSECTPKAPYSAALATHILYETPVFKNIETLLIEQSKWDTELIDLKLQLELCALPK